jgi:hypothetical protein
MKKELFSVASADPMYIADVPNLESKELPTKDFMR